MVVSRTLTLSALRETSARSELIMGSFCYLTHDYLPCSWCDLCCVWHTMLLDFICLYTACLTGWMSKLLRCDFVAFSSLMSLNKSFSVVLLIVSFIFVIPIYSQILYKHGTYIQIWLSFRWYKICLKLAFMSCWIILPIITKHAYEFKNIVEMITYIVI